MQQNSVILYFVKNPLPGKVKTRLAKSIGSEAAAAHYKKLAFQNYEKLRALQENKLDTWVTYDPPESLEQIKSWLPGAKSYLSQGSGTLDERLIFVFRSAFEAGVWKVFALGSDTLELDVSWMTEAERALDQHDVVLGPAEDGGYYCIGLKRLDADLFRGIDWSTPKVLKQTLEIIEKKKLSYHLLPTTRDLDEVSDLDLVKEN